MLVLLPKALSKPLLLLFDDLPPPHQLAVITTGDERWIAPWLKAIALYTVAEMPSAVQAAPVLQEAVAQAAAGAELLEQEAAAWVIRRGHGAVPAPRPTADH